MSAYQLVVAVVCWQKKTTSFRLGQQEQRPKTKSLEKKKKKSQYSTVHLEECKSGARPSSLSHSPAKAHFGRSILVQVVFVAKDDSIQQPRMSGALARQVDWEKHPAGKSL